MPRESEMKLNQNSRGVWRSRWGFILASTGAAVGLGNIWRFPYIAGENSGGLFVLIYLGFILLVGLPILVEPRQQASTWANAPGHCYPPSLRDLAVGA